MNWRRSIKGLWLAGLLLPGCLPTHQEIRQDGFIAPLAPMTPVTTSAKPVVQLPPNEAVKVSLTVAAEFEQKGEDGAALVQYERARQHDPNIPNLSRKLAILYDRVGNEARALEEYQKCLAAHPKDVELLNNMGYFFYSRRRLPEAEQHLRKALALDSKHARAWVNLGLTLGQMERYAEALEAFQHAVSPAEAQSNLGFILATQGKRDEAKQAYRQALALQPSLMIAQVALSKLEHPQPTNEGVQRTPPNAGPRAMTRPDRPPPSSEPQTLPPLEPVVVPGPNER